MCFMFEDWQVNVKVIKVCGLTNIALQWVVESLKGQKVSLEIPLLVQTKGEICMNSSILSISLD